MSPRSEEENQHIKDERREQILKAARQVFVRKGLAATKIADIAAAAGTSHGLVYHYFPSKEAVYSAIVEEALEGSMLVTAGALEQPGTPWERIRWACELMLTGVRTSPEYFLIIVQTFTNLDVMPEEAKAALRRRGAEPFIYLVQLIQAGQAAGEVVAGNPAELVLTFLATIQGLAISSLYGKEMAQFFPSADTVLRLLKA